MDTTGNDTNGNNLAALLKGLAAFEGRKVAVHMTLYERRLHEVSTQ